MNGGELARLTRVTHGTTVIVGIEGDVDNSNADAVRDEIDGSLSNLAFALILDLSQTRYLDSAGIQLLLDLGERLRGRGQQFLLCVPPRGPLRLTVTLFELQRAFPVTGSPEEALAQIDAVGASE